MNTKDTSRHALLACSALVLASLGLPRALATNVVDLTAGGTAVLTNVGNTGVLITTDQQSTGTGVIDPFLRVQSNGSEAGYNANGNNVMPNVKTGNWTHDIQLQNLAVVTNPGGHAGTYYEFLLDINQNNNNGDNLLSLNTLKFYTRPTAIPDASTLANLTGSSTLKWNMDGDGSAAQDVRVQLDYNLNAGSGQGDLLVYIPTSNFTGVNPTSFLYLYTEFGTDSTTGATGTSFASNDGFEEWAALTGAATVPDSGTTVTLLGGALIAIAALRRRFRLV